MRMLEDEGFAFEGYVDIFDGGPTMTARTDQGPHDPRCAKAAIVDRASRRAASAAMLAAGRLAELPRAAYGKVTASARQRGASTASPPRRSACRRATRCSQSAR